jgi:hypothetical protein
MGSSSPLRSDPDSVPCEAAGGALRRAPAPGPDEHGGAARPAEGRRAYARSCRSVLYPERLRNDLAAELEVAFEIRVRALEDQDLLIHDLAVLDGVTDHDVPGVA